MSVKGALSNVLLIARLTIAGHSECHQVTSNIGDKYSNKSYIEYHSLHQHPHECHQKQIKECDRYPCTYLLHMHGTNTMGMQ